MRDKSELKERFLNIPRIKNRYKKGKEFENMIHDILHEEGWNPKKNISNRLQQIDLIAYYENFVMLLEAKAIRSPLGSPHVEKLFGILSSRPMNTIGIIFTLNGVTKTAKTYLDRICSKRTLMIFERVDLSYILEDRITLSDLFTFKLRNLYEKGITHSTARDFLDYFILNLNEDYGKFEFWRISYFFNNYFEIPISKRFEIAEDLLGKKESFHRTLVFLNQKFDSIDEKEKSLLFDQYEKDDEDLAFIFASYHERYPMRIIKKYRHKMIQLIKRFHQWVVDTDADAALSREQTYSNHLAVERALAKLGALSESGDS